MNRMINIPLAGLMAITMITASHAGGGSNGTSMNALAANGLGRQSSVKTLDDYLRNLPMDAPFGEAPASPAKDPVRREMADTDLLNSAQGRETLKYLIECALPESVELFSVREGVEYKFRGGMNLAPNWLDERPTVSEERWVSACMLARTNYFRKKVMISMQTRTEPTPEYLVPLPEEAVATIYEGDFFGNLFTENPTAYACIGDRTEEQNHDDILKARICTEQDEGITGAPMPVSYCSFFLTGPCSRPGSHVVNGVEYKENISVYLRPLGPRKKESPSISGGLQNLERRGSGEQM